jgi:hypothetical protein
MTFSIPIIIHEIEAEGFHPHTQIKINGQYVNMLLDTGASKTVFDSNAISSMIDNLELNPHDKLTTGLGTNSMESHFAEIGKLEIGEFFMENYVAVFLDLSHVNESYQHLEIPTIAGVLGSDFLVTLNAVVDFKEKKLVLISGQ